MKTQQLVLSSGAGPLGKLGDELMNSWVSSTSRWLDPRWYLDTSEIYKQVLVNWDIAFDDGSNLLHDVRAKLLQSCRVFIWYLISDASSDGSSKQVGTISSIMIGIRSILKWMVNNGVETFEDLTRAKLDEYLADLPLMLANSSDDEEEPDIGIRQAYTRLRVPNDIYNYRRALAKYNVKHCAQPSWQPYQVAAQVATKADAQILPIPAEVAIRILNQAVRFMGVIADDVISCADLQYRTMTTPTPGGYGKPQGHSYNVRWLLWRRRLKKFEFSILEGEKVPWARLGTDDAVDVDLSSGWLRQQLEDLRAACSIIVMAMTGMRYSELAFIEAGMDEGLALPSCVSVATSISGTYELFLLSTKLSKTETRAREEQWVIGIRPRGSSEIPIGVRALTNLNRLVAVYGVGHNLLFSWFGQGGGERLNPINFSPPRSDLISIAQKNFIVRNVDLSSIPDTSSRAIISRDLVIYRETGGRCIRPAQWRKNFSHFVFNVDSRLLPALTDQYKHTSIALTEGSYIGTKQATFDDLDGARSQETARILFEMATGESIYTGRMGDQLTANIGQVRDLIRDVAPEEAFDKVLNFVMDAKLRVWFTAWGDCMPISLQKMSCHRNAGTTPDRTATPNYGWRNAVTCSGCACNLFHQRHVPFWTDRYAQSIDAIAQAERCGRKAGLRVLRDRSRQARALLSSLGIDVNGLVARKAN